MNHRTTRAGRSRGRRRLAVLATAAVVGALTTSLPAQASPQGSSTGTGVAHRAARDTDHDGLTDRYERAHRLDPRDEDTDNDGMDDGDEVKDRSRTTDPRRADTDRDGVKDGDEDADRDGVDNEDEDDALETCVADDDDRDGDHVDDEDENDLGTRAGNADSDRDGVPDGEEISRGHRVANEDLDDSPSDRCVVDRDGDGEDDEDHGDYLGTIASFDAATGTLVLDGEGGQLTYVVTAATEIGFEGAGDEAREHGRHGGRDDRRVASAPTGRGGDDGGDAGDEGDDHGAGEGHDGRDESDGTTADLLPGTLVAEVKIARDGSVREIELYRPAAAPSGPSAPAGPGA
ncbi:hypothetical protein K8Z61_08140 [Nocardioides sp. TRM66260-LWL]|uniref:hypothetical protein n=1 Tax=Nocardioides sp. TRM66260-LWL TaxID=2874478 RepID=UPI001CC452AC|nr:hypothetical protein [Nocardioides sp. TRM66260-LWL]MBZ5734465.1 hypothetical protein [Nocardioides sp. TRM66260-LWL]